MRVAFTGHRECEEDLSKELTDLMNEFPGAVWAHGGARGFDSIAGDFAKAHGIPVSVHLPDYYKHGRRAPLVRNHDIVEGAELLIAWYDGRGKGGTLYTIRLAEEAGIPVRNWFRG